MSKISLISHDLDLTAKLICFNARQIQLENYAQNGYLVLPHLVPGQPQTIYFPNFPYTSNFWKTISKLHNYSLTAHFPPIAISELKSHLQNYVFPDATKLNTEWGSQSEKFIATLSAQFSPGFLASISEITILLTEFGTLGSFSKLKHLDGTFSLLCSSRVDFPVENVFNIITQGLILCFQSGYNDLGTIGWHQRQALISYLSTQTSLAPFISLPPTPTLDHQLYLASQNYLFRLGFSPQPSLDPKVLLPLLTPAEHRLFTCLYQNPNTIVSFDDSATAVWRDQVEAKYSLYAMAKLIENLRRKIRSTGTNRDLIRTFRKQGYMLVD